jgi:hypothetical protein
MTCESLNDDIREAMRVSIEALFGDYKWQLSQEELDIAAARIELDAQFPGYRGENAISR